MNRRGLCGVSDVVVRRFFMRLAHLARALAVAVLAFVPPSAANAQSPADFYKGKTID